MRVRRRKTRRGARIRSRRRVGGVRSGFREGRGTHRDPKTEPVGANSSGVRPHTRALQVIPQTAMSGGEPRDILPICSMVARCRFRMVNSHKVRLRKKRAARAQFYLRIFSGRTTNPGEPHIWISAPPRPPNRAALPRRTRAHTSARVPESSRSTSPAKSRRSRSPLRPSRVVAVAVVARQS